MIILVQVSDNFKNLAAQPGRKLSCKIEAGDYTYLDDRIIEFDFDDIAHPDYYTIGTTCPNRFAFSVRYQEELAVGAEVKPYISFDGEEWCPLGVFFITRRYIRGSYASIICYDRMYSLDDAYSSSLSAPTTTSALLREICSNHGLSCSNYGADIEVKYIPSGCTVRDMIGYIAAMNSGIAKFDRNGALRMIIHRGNQEFFLYEKNCMECQRNLSTAEIKRIVADTGDKILEYGSAGELGTIEIFNPLMTETVLSSIRTNHLVVRFHGAEIEMQGMPFLEAGEFIHLTGKGYLNTIVLSEINYHYNGALTAKLHSRNRSYSDPTVHKNELEAALAEIRTSLGNIYKTHTNEASIALSTTETEAVLFSFETKKSDMFAQIDMNFTVDGGGSNSLIAAVYVNGAKMRESVHTVNGSSRELLHFHYLADELPKGVNAIRITLRTVSGQMTVQSGQLVATLVGKGMAGGNRNVHDRQVIFESIPTITLKYGGFKLADISYSLQTEEAT